MSLQLRSCIKLQQAITCLGCVEERASGSMLDQQQGEKVPPCLLGFSGGAVAWLVGSRHSLLYQWAPFSHVQLLVFCLCLPGSLLCHKNLAAFGEMKGKQAPEECEMRLGKFSFANFGLFAFRGVELQIPPLKASQAAAFLKMHLSSALAHRHLHN